MARRGKRGSPAHPPPGSRIGRRFRSPARRCPGCQVGAGEADKFTGPQGQLVFANDDGRDDPISGTQLSGLLLRVDKISHGVDEQ
ncbi:MAG: hypothetical protein CAPSK01_004217 [Candidatus Accumulibacter vicinus]|uniref:Uncharacterized protein n=1 Tax=Candidatus Accumulibacter vicinus TaxID=2954382 RepID=A0A084XV34_9PROT|nr:MAG: hypothetical protein CAPSK01_004217 [Candidatus Accumulibacter vicinus]